MGFISASWRTGVQVSLSLQTLPITGGVSILTSCTRFTCSKARSSTKSISVTLPIWKTGWSPTTRRAPRDILCDIGRGHWSIPKRSPIKSRPCEGKGNSNPQGEENSSVRRLSPDRNIMGAWDPYPPAGGREFKSPSRYKPFRFPGGVSILTPCSPFTCSIARSSRRFPTALAFDQFISNNGFINLFAKGSAYSNL